MLKRIKHIILTLYLVWTGVVQGQILVRSHQLSIDFDSVAHTLHLTQKSIIVNHFNKPVKDIILLNWANAYAGKHTDLAQAFMENYNLNFHFTASKNRGEVILKTLSAQGRDLSSELHHLKADVYRLSIPKSLLPNDSLMLDMQYDIKLPNSKFTGYGIDKKANVLLKNFYFQPVPYKQQTYANKNIDNYPAFPSQFQIHFKNFPSGKHLFTNLMRNDSLNLSGIVKTPLILITSRSYENYRFENQNIILPENTSVSHFDKSLILHRILNFLEQKAGKYPGQTILITGSDFKNHKVYGFDLLPKILNPYEQNFVWEFSVLHQIVREYTSVMQNDRRQNAWLQDGMSAYWEYEYLNRFYPGMPLLGKLSEYKLTRFFYASQVKMSEKYPWLYLNVARLNKDQPLRTALDSLTNYNRNVMMPYKAALGLKILHDLQPDTFDDKLKKFYRKAVTKPVSPKDFFNEVIEKKDIKWFRNYIMTKQKYDYKLQKIIIKDDSIYLKIRNKNHYLLPLTVYGVKADSIVFKKQLPAFMNDTLIGLKNGHFDFAGFNYFNDYPEYQNGNNFKRPGFHILNKPLQIRPFQDFDNPLRTQVFVNPFVEYNFYDGIIAGTQIFNESLLFNHFKYVITPSYGFKSRTLTGGMSLSHIHYFKSDKPFALDFGIGFKYFHYNHNLVYRRYNPHIELKFRDPYLRKRKGYNIGLQYMYIDKDPVGATQDETERYGVLDLRFKRYHINVIKDFFYNADLQLAQNFGKLSLMLRYRFLSDKNRQWDFRIFAGKFLYNRTQTDYFSFALDRPTDYLFQYHYYGRSENSGIFHQQFIWAEGGFKSFFDDQFANDYLISNNVNIGIWRWFNLYADGAWLKRKSRPLNFYYDSGIRINLVQDYFEVFFPVYSKLGWETAQPNYLSKIRMVFTMDINGLFKMIKRGWY